MADKLPSGKRICIEQVPWSELPSLVLENIYYLLDPSDRLNMSLVCHNWSKEFNSPSIWESFRLLWIDDYKHIDPLTVMQRDPWEHPDIRSVRKYSRLLKHVLVYIDIHEQFSDPVLEYWFESFIKFLEVFSETSQLHSVRFRGLSYFCYQRIDEYLEFPIYNQSCQAIANFLGSQRQLKKLEFKECSFEYKDLTDLLNETLKHSKESLEILTLGNVIDYFDDDKQDTMDDQILPAIFRFPNLTTLTIDYWLIFGTRKANLSNVLKHFKNCQQQTVLKVLLVIDDDLDFKKFKLLESNDWRCMKLQYPFLEVELNVGRLPASMQPPKVFIVEYMPVTRLEYHFYDYCSLKNLYPMDINAFLKYLLYCKINENLVFFLLSWAKPISNLASAFLPFLNESKKLSHLNLSTVYPPNNLDVLLESLLVNQHESLREFKLTVYNAQSRNNIANLKSLISKFDCRLKSARIYLEAVIHL